MQVPPPSSNDGELSQASTGPGHKVRTRQAPGRSGEPKQLRSPLLVVISAPDVYALQAPLLLLRLPSWARAGLATVMKCRAARESRGGKKGSA